jgi:hypothetical protein
MVLMGDRRPEQGHDAIAQELVHRALKAVHGVHHVVQGRIQELLRRFGVEVFDQLGGVFDIGKEHGDLLAFALEGRAGRQNLLLEVGWGVGQRGSCRRRSWHVRCERDRRGVDGPDQSAPAFINHLGMGKEDGFFEILKVVIVKGKLALQGAIGDPDVLLQHGDRLAEDFVERHGGSSACGVGPRCASTAAHHTTTPKGAPGMAGPRGLIGLSPQLCQQCLGLLEVGGVKALGEPAVDRREQLARCVPLALLLPQSAQARGRAQL